VNLVAAARPSRQSSVRYRKTAFERNLLPDFAEWLVQQVERWQPDFLIPAETKGARLLDAALAYARDVLGTPISVPVIYSSALAYIDPALLQGSRVTIVDDAVCTGANLDLHREWIARFDVAEIQSLVCVGLSEGDIARTPKRRNVKCFLSVNRKVYERCIWQLAELVIARGLPPEVDHFVFEARVPGGLAPTWRELERVLPTYGHLTIDGPATRPGQVLPMTLHFPQLPGRPGRPSLRPRLNCPDKLRLFPYPVHDRFLALPISLPSLTLPPGVNPEGALSPDWAHERITEVFGGPDPIGDLLVDDAEFLHARTVFRALSCATEIELMRGFAQVLGETVPGASLSPQQEPFDRLYGPASGEHAFTLVNREVSDALARGAEHAGSAQREAPSVEEPPFLDASVAATTRTIAKHLKAMYDDRDPTERLGLTMAEIADELKITDPVLLSRCISFGLAMTTLVPYVDVRQVEDGTYRAERFYRVSENNRGQGQPYTDIDRIQCDKSGQTLALVCHRIRTTCASFADAPIPEDLLTALVGVLSTLVFEEKGIALCARPGEEGLELFLLDGVPPVSFDSPSSYYKRIDGGVVPSEKFCTDYKAGHLSLDLDGSTAEIESHVDLLTYFVERLEPADLDRLLTTWAMSTDRRLGLEHVRKSLRAALEELRKPLKLILGGQEHAASTGTGGIARKRALAAACKLRQLSSDWSLPARERWQRSGRLEQSLIKSLCAPSSEGRAIYSLPIALATITAALGEVVENLDVVSARHWVDGGEITASAEADRERAVGAAINWSAVIRHRLTSLDGEGEAPSVSDQPAEAIAEAATALLDTIDMIDAFVSASAGEFRGTKSEGRPEGSVDEKRDVSVLAADIGGSTPFADLHGEIAAHRWKEGALNISAQWTRAFGAWPIGDRRGDEIRVEFDETADAAVLCASVIQQHMAALRSTEGEDISWSLHCGVHSGQVQDGFENVTGSPIDIASKLAKYCDEHCDTDNVFITREARSRCSPELREKPLATQLEGSNPGPGPVKSRPFAIDSAGVMKLWTERLQEAGDWIVQEPFGGAGEGPLWFGPDPDELVDDEATEPAAD
jgi:adenine/guanine phosphoribosyltransferase-like PRPP-binding protein